MLLHELMNSDNADAGMPPSSPLSRKRHSVGAFPQHLLQSEDEATSDDDNHDDDDDDDTASQTSAKRFRADSPAPASPVTDSSASVAAPAMTPSRKDTLPAAAAVATSSRPNMSASHSITLEMLRPHFEEPLAQVAKSFGICVTLLKKICRKHGISRWPHRQITGLRKSIASMEHAIGYFEGARRDSYAEQLRKQKNKLALLLEDPTKCNPPPAAMPSSPSDVPLLHRHPAFPSPGSVSSYASPLPRFTASPFELQQHSVHASYPQQCDFDAMRSAPVAASFVAPAPALRSTPYQPAMSMTNLYLPPLCTDSRRVLPSIASLVGNSSGSW